MVYLASVITNIVIKRLTTFYKMHLQEENMRNIQEGIHCQKDLILTMIMTRVFNSYSLFFVIVSIHVH